MTFTSRLRLATPDDAPTVWRIYAPFVAKTAVSFERDPPTVVEMRSRIESTLPEYPWLVAERETAASNPQVVGYAYAGPFRSRPAYQWAIECSVYVAPDARRRGIARSLYRALFDLLGRQGYHTAYAGMTVPNEASAALHESMGFTSVGTFQHAGYKLGEWHDVQWWQRPLDSHGNDDSPVSLRTLAELADEELAAALDTTSAERAEE